MKTWDSSFWGELYCPISTAIPLNSFLHSEFFCLKFWNFQFFFFLTSQLLIHFRFIINAWDNSESFSITSFLSARNVTVRDLKYNWKANRCGSGLNEIFFSFAPTLPSFVVAALTHKQMVVVVHCACISKQHLTLVVLHNLVVVVVVVVVSMLDKKNNNSVFASESFSRDCTDSGSAFIISLSKVSTSTSPKNGSLTTFWFKIKRNTNYFITETKECCVAWFSDKNLRWCSCL